MQKGDFQPSAMPVPQQAAARDLRFQR